MHTLRNRIMFFGSTLAAGLLSLGLHSAMMTYYIDDKGLLMAGNLPGKLLWVVGIAFVAGLAYMLRTIGGDGSYEENFPACWLSGGLMMAAGVAMAWAVPGLALDTRSGVEQELSMAVSGIMAWAAKFLPWLAVGSMAVLGILRMLGKRPWPILCGIICLFYMLMLVTNYRLWSADPRVYEYAYQLLAGVLLMLASFHRTCADAQIIQRKKLLATGLGAAVCCTAALSGEFQWGFYLASGLWAAGSMCNVAVLPPDPEEEPEEESETEE